jgi:hypothetical protein
MIKLMCPTKGDQSFSIDMTARVDRRAVGVQQGEGGSEQHEMKSTIRKGKREEMIDQIGNEETQK